jgi:hypothetical protein
MVHWVNNAVKNLIACRIDNREIEMDSLRETVRGEEKQNSDYG